MAANAFPLRIAFPLVLEWATDRLAKDICAQRLPSFSKREWLQRRKVQHFGHAVVSACTCNVAALCRKFGSAIMMCTHQALSNARCHTKVGLPARPADSDWSDG